MRLRGLLLAGLVVVLFASMSGSASAAFTYTFAGDLEPSGGAFGSLDANSVAVDNANGDTYVASSSGVDVFETSTGAQLASLDGSLTPAGSYNPTAVAVNEATGDVYVVDDGNNVVDVFDGAGSYVCQITGSPTPSASECNGVAGSDDTSTHGFNGPRGIEVEQATGDVYVLNAAEGAVEVFGPGGAYLRQISLESIPTGFSEGSTRGLAVDAVNGDVYLSDSLGGDVYVFNAAGEYVTTWSGANTPARSFGGGFVSVTADDTTGEVYVTDSAHQVTDIFSPSGEYLTQIPESSLEGVGTTVDQASGNVYISDNAEHVVFIFDAVPVPDVTTEAASNVLPTSATLNGTVNPDGLPITSCVFEYGTRTSYGQSVPCAQTPGSGSGPVAVSADVSGLQEGATYHFRLVAENANGRNRGFDEEVTAPAAPTIDSATDVNLGVSSVDLRAAINPHAAPSTYRFEYGTSTAYGTSIPVPDGTIAPGLTDRTVLQHVSGLLANTTYHWRVVARNLAGVTTGSDHTFIYSTSGGGLPNGRAYEMVTPPAKNAAQAGDVPIAGIPPDVSADGSRVMMVSTQCFGNAVSCPADESGRAGTPYEFTRTSDGWATTALAPPATRFDRNTREKVSADGGTALFMMPTPPMGEEDWYARKPDGSFVDIGPTSPPAAGFISVPLPTDQRLGTTADLSHIVYESPRLWPFGASGELVGNLYEYVGEGNAAPSLVGVSGGAGSTDLISNCGERLGYGGTGGVQPYGGMSADGRTVFFTVAPCASGSGVNTGVEVPAEELYARIDESRTVPISARSPLECTGATGCLASPPGDSNFIGASNDGSRAFFLDTQQLTDGASEDSHSGDNAKGCSQTTGVNGCNLYEYDFANPAGRNLTAVSAGDTSGGGPRVQGVLAISADGSHVYFVARGVLTGAANERGQTARDGAENMYVFERDASHPEGRVAFIASLPESDDEQGHEHVWAGNPLVEDVTPDGRYLVFTSRAALTADASGSTGRSQVFRYDALTGDLVRISIGEGGFNDNGNAGVGNASIVAPYRYHLGSPRGNPTMSDDGSYVFFESPVGLTPEALDDVQIPGEEGAAIEGGPAYAENVYEWHEGHVYLLSDGRDVSGTTSAFCQHQSSVCLFGSDATGANVFFTTGDSLVLRGHRYGG